MSKKGLTVRELIKLLDQIPDVQKDKNVAFQTWDYFYDIVSFRNEVGNIILEGE